MPHLTQELLKQILQYDPETGVWTWLADLPNGRKKSGTVAGCINASGYHVMTVRGTVYRSHRLAWFYMTGEWPADQIDHKDADRSNNRWSNLREATISQNLRNSMARGRSRLKGAGWNNKTKKWASSVTVDSKRIRLGIFDCPAAAHFAYLIAADQHYGEFARAR